MRNTNTARLVIAATAAGLTACGGGGSSSPITAAPAISGFANTTIEQDATAAPLSFTVSDADSPPESLLLSVESASPDLLPEAGLQITGTGTERTLLVTPAADVNGEGTVTLTVRDERGAEARRSARIRVSSMPVNFSAVLNDAFVTAEDGDLQVLRGRQVLPDVDDDPAAFDTLLQ
jgi:hypothetical protein